MGVETKIEWCDHTFNPWRGCTKVHAGCANCYAETLSKRNPKTLGIWGRHGMRVVAVDKSWGEPLKWDAAAAAEGVRRRVFCASLADVFEDWDMGIVYPGRKEESGEWINGVAWYGPKKVGGTIRNEVLHAGQMLMGQAYGKQYRQASMDDLRARLFALIDATPNLDWLLVTKRPENVRRMWPQYETYRVDSVGRPLPLRHQRPNVWLLTSISDQKTADAMVPELLKCRDLVPVLGISAEPLLGPVNVRRFFHHSIHCIECHPGGEPCRCSRLDWVITGGESGHGARPCRVQWIEDLTRQCADDGIPCFNKQLGANAIVNDEETSGFDVRLDLRDPKGGDWNEWPADLRVREWPQAGVIE